MAKRKAAAKDGAIFDPETYRRMCEPHESVEAADAAYRRFYDDMRKVREKHRIAEVVVVTAMYEKDGDREGVRIRCGGMGDSSKIERMLAVALGASREQTDRELDEASAKRKPAEPDA